jgi:hypothetical protein
VRKEENFEHRFLKSFWEGYKQEYFIKEKEKEKTPKFNLYRDLLVRYINKMWDLKNLKENQKLYINMIEESILRRKAIFDN